VNEVIRAAAALRDVCDDVNRVLFAARFDRRRRELES